MYFLKFRFSPHIFLTLLFACLLFSSAHGQLTDLGFGLGGFNFTGDMTKYYDLRNSRPALSIYMRSNITDAIGLRYGFTGGQISGTDNDPDDPIDMDPFTNYVVEASVNMEYHFLDFKSKHSRIHWTPYLYFGAGMFFVFGSEKTGDYSRFQPMIPLGFGFKYSTSPKIDIGIEASARSTFFDYLDNNSGGDIPDEDYEYVRDDRSIAKNEVKEDRSLIQNDITDDDVFITVVKGDTLYSIARNNNLSVDDLKRINGLDSNELSIGMKLLVSK